MLKRIMESIGTSSVDGVENITVKRDKSDANPKDKDEVSFEIGSLVMVGELKVGKVKSVKGDDVEVLYKDGTVTTAKAGDVVNIVVK